MRRSHDPEYMERQRVRAERARENKPYRLVQMFHTVKQSAKKRGIAVEIQKSDIAAMMEAQNWKCAKTGVSFDLTSGKGKQPFGPSVDRIDNARGYEPSNIQIVCTIYNYAKNEFSDDSVLIFANALVDHSFRSLQERLRRRHARTL